MKDISEFYTGHRPYDEEIGWILSGQYKRHLEFVLPKIAEYGVKSVIEWGCGSGLLASGLPKDLLYIGIDNNAPFVEMAKRRLMPPIKKVMQCDARKFKMAEDDPWDLSMAWTFLKHFGLHEWDDVLGKILKSGRYATFNVMLLGEDFDNGTEYRHVYVCEEHLQEAIKTAGHEILHREIYGESTVEGKGTMRDLMLWTRSKS